MNAIAEKPVPAIDLRESQPTPPRRRALLRRTLRPALAFIALVGVAVTGSWWFTEGRWIESTDNAYIQGDIAVLSPRIDGQVASILVADNQHVRAGDELIELDPTDWQARVAQARASAAEADAAVVTAHRQIIQQQS
ncbi:MAG TPA: biotin/lipoyl-binding protein, partial [Acetobacteraceae bacterium]